MPNRRPKILIVDDDPKARIILEILLKNEGYETASVASGREARTLLADMDFDTVLTDLVMPGMSGLELLEAVRAKDRELPVILMTGHPDVPSAISSTNWSVTRYLIKPVSHAEMLKELKRACHLYEISKVRRKLAELLDEEEMARVRHEEQTQFDGMLSHLAMHFQPIVYSKTEEVMGYEALLRSSSPAFKGPLPFLQLASKLGQQLALNQTIFKTVAEVVARIPDKTFFVNTAITDFVGDLLLVGNPLESVAEQIVFEITERTPLEEIYRYDTKVNFDIKINKIRSQGYRIAIDDFGAGYSTLSSLGFLPLDIVKLDMSLVRDIDKREVLQTLVAGMIDVSHQLVRQVVAEGVETKGERDFLRDHHCDFLQGYFFGMPAPIP